MLFRRKKPITHALGLWIIVGLAGVLLVCGSAYTLALMRLTQPIPGSYGLKNPVTAAQLPSLFGRILAIEGDILRVDTKQPFNQVMVDDLTKLTGLTGTRLTLPDLSVGSLISATGKDIGGGRLVADAVAVIQSGAAAPAPQPQAGLLQAPSDWKAWATMPPLIGWGNPGSKYLAALRGYDLKAPAVSIELYDATGKLSGRIELDVQGYKHLKPLNDFLAPAAAETALAADGIQASSSLVSPDGKWRLDVAPKADGTRTVKFTKL